MPLYVVRQRGVADPFSRFMPSPSRARGRVRQRPELPSFCHECGHAYPWVGKRLQAAKDLADELDELSDEEKQKLKATLDDLIPDTPQTEVAGTRFKKIMRRAACLAWLLTQNSAL